MLAGARRTCTLSGAHHQILQVLQNYWWWLCRVSFFAHMYIRGTYAMNCWEHIPDGDQKTLRMPPYLQHTAFPTRTPCEVTSGIHPLWLGQILETSRPWSVTTSK
jgi:hypothetical protein